MNHRIIQRNQHHLYYQKKQELLLYQRLLEQWRIPVVMNHWRRRCNVVVVRVVGTALLSAAFVLLLVLLLLHTNIINGGGARSRGGGVVYSYVLLTQQQRQQPRFRSSYTSKFRQQQMDDDDNNDAIISTSSSTADTTTTTTTYNYNTKQPYTRPILDSIRLFISFVYNQLHLYYHKQRLLTQVIIQQQQRRRQQQRQRRRIKSMPSSMQQEKDDEVIKHEIIQRTSKRNPLTSLVQSIRKQYQQLNQQRMNIVTLANYGSHIVYPSFISLTIGALLVSIVPHYYAKCITCLATVVVATSSSSSATTAATAAAAAATATTTSKLFSAMIGLLISVTAAAFFTGLRGSFFWIGGSRANYNIRVKLHYNLLLQETAFYDINETGTLLSRLNSDVNKIGQVISYHVNVVCRQLAQFIFGSIYLIRISPILSLYTFIGIILVAIISAIYGNFNRNLAQQLQDTFANATAVAETSFSMSETIRAFDGVTIESNKYELAQREALDIEEIQAWGYGTHKFVSDTVQGILEVLLLLSCYYYGRLGLLSPQQLTTFMFYANFILESSNEVGDQWAKIQGAVGASTSVFDLIRRIPSIRDPISPTELVDDNTITTSSTATTTTNTSTNTNVVSSSSIAINGAKTLRQESNKANNNDNKPIIRMTNMTVQYAGDVTLNALNNINLNIYNGDRIAIVGRSGSGKSSMLRTILRFYDPIHGTVLLDDVPLPQLTRHQLAQKVTIVEQEPSLFPMTMLENVLYGIPEDTVDPITGKARYSKYYEDLVMKALDEAGLPIYDGNDLNLTLYSRVGDGGRSLSGGQRQRVAIARALVRNPQVLLLDEPTAALDTESEKVVLQALRRAMEYADCLVMVTHRLNVISSLGINRVIVMDKGTIIEDGHPDILIKKKENGYYARLAREQGLVDFRTM